MKWKVTSDSLADTRILEFARSKHDSTVVDLTRRYIACIALDLIRTTTMTQEMAKQRICAELNFAQEENE